MGANTVIDFCKTDSGGVPDTYDTYSLTGTFNGQPLFTGNGELGKTPWFVWYDRTNQKWTYSASPGSRGSAFWTMSESEFYSFHLYYSNRVVWNPGGEAENNIFVALGLDVGTIAATSWVDPQNDTQFNVSNPENFAFLDLITSEADGELMIVTNVVGSELSVIRGEGGSNKVHLETGNRLVLLERP